MIFMFFYVLKDSYTMVTLGALRGLLGRHILCVLLIGVLEFKKIQKFCVSVCFQRFVYNGHMPELPGCSRMHPGGAF